MSAELVRLIAAQIFLHACMTAMRMAAPLWALRQGYSALAVGMLLALFALTQVFLALPAGRYADRHGLRRRYSELVRRYHPDRNGGDRSHEGHLQRVVEAYQLLRQAAAFA